MRADRLERKAMRMSSQRNNLGMVLLLALLVSGITAPAQAEVVVADRVSAGHPVAMKIQKTLESGEAFNVDFMILQKTATPEQSRAVKESAAAMMKELRATFAEKLQVELVEGLDFSVGKTDLPLVAMSCRMEGEQKGRPSRFRLVTSRKRQVYLVYSANDKNGVKQLIHLLVWPVEGRWRAVDFYVVPTSLCGLNAEEALDVARRAEKVQQIFHAGMFYAVAYRLTTTATCRMSSLRRRLQRGLRDMAHKTGASGRPLDTIELPNVTMTIEKLAVSDLEDGPYLEVYGHVERVEPPEKMQPIQKLIAAACLKNHPMIKRYFKGIVVASVSEHPAQHGKGYRSPHKIADLQKKP